MSALMRLSCLGTSSFCKLATSVVLLLSIIGARGVDAAKDAHHGDGCHLPKLLKGNTDAEDVNKVVKSLAHMHDVAEMVGTAGDDADSYDAFVAELTKFEVPADVSIVVVDGDGKGLAVLPDDDGVNTYDNFDADEIKGNFKDKPDPTYVMATEMDLKGCGFLAKMSKDGSEMGYIGKTFGDGMFRVGKPLDCSGKSDLCTLAQAVGDEDATDGGKMVDMMMEAMNDDDGDDDGGDGGNDD